MTSTARSSSVNCTDPPEWPTAVTVGGSVDIDRVVTYRQQPP